MPYHVPDPPFLPPPSSPPSPLPPPSLLPTLRRSLWMMQRSCWPTWMWNQMMRMMTSSLVSGYFPCCIHPPQPPPFHFPSSPSPSPSPSPSSSPSPSVLHPHLTNVALKLAVVKMYCQKLKQRAFRKWSAHALTCDGVGCSVC